MQVRPRMSHAEAKVTTETLPSRSIRNELYNAREKVDAGVVDKELFDVLRGLGVNGIEGDVAYGGEGLYMTEVMRVLEEFSVSMALSEAVTVANTIAVAPLARYVRWSRRPLILSLQSITVHHFRKIRDL